MLKSQLTFWWLSIVFAKTNIEPPSCIHGVSCMLQADGSDAAEAGSSVAHAMSGLSLKEENDMRVEHALDILKADVRHSA